MVTTICREGPASSSSKKMDVQQLTMTLEDGRYGYVVVSIVLETSGRLSIVPREYSRLIWVQQGKGHAV